MLIKSIDVAIYFLPNMKRNKSPKKKIWSWERNSKGEGEER